MAWSPPAWTPATSWCWIVPIPPTARAVATKRGIWATLKQVLVPDHHAHPYAEGVSRGHPLVVADVTEAQRDAAEAALQAAHPDQYRHPGAVLGR